MIEFKDIDIGTTFWYDSILLEKVTAKTALNIGYPVNGAKRVYYLSQFNLVEVV